MAKKRANKGGSANPSVMVQRTAQGRTYNQIHPDQKSRRSKHKRIEFVLNPAYAEDRNIIALMGTLRGGDKSDYIRESLALKMEDDERPPMHELFEDMMQTIKTLNQTIEDLRAEVASMKRGINVKAAAAVSVSFGNEQDDPGTVTQSSGLNMDSPRPRPTIARAQPAQIEAPEPDVLTDADRERLGYEMAMSIKNAQIGGTQ